MNTLSSLPSWEAWIEVGLLVNRGANFVQSLPSWEAWIEVHRFKRSGKTCQRRFPHGKRGLKLLKIIEMPGVHPVASLMGSVD